MKANIFIRLREDVPDYPGESIRQRLFENGTSDVKAVRIGKVVTLEFDGGDEATVTDRVKRLCQDVFVNDTVEEYVFTIEE